MPPAAVSLPFLAWLLLTMLLRHVHVVDAECEPVACGNFTIKYPFWLGAPSRPPPEPSCGHPAFELWCINGNTTAAMSGSPIHVHSIDYATSSLVVVHSRVAAGTDGVCLADFNVSSSLALSPFRVSPSNRALGFLFNCNGTEPRGREYANATAGCSRPILAYLGGSFVRDTPPAIPTGNCTYTYLPVLGSEAAASTAADYTRLLKAGFLLDWAGAGAGDCPTCIATGGQCRYRSATTAFACLCPGGKLRGPTCADEGITGHSAAVVVAVAPVVDHCLSRVALAWDRDRLAQLHVRPKHRAAVPGSYAQRRRRRRRGRLVLAALAFLAHPRSAPARAHPSAVTPQPPVRRQFKSRTVRACSAVAIPLGRRLIRQCGGEAQVPTSTFRQAKVRSSTHER